MRLQTNDERDTYTVERLIGQKTGLLQRVEFTTRSRDVGDTVIANVAASTDPEELGFSGISADLAAVGKGRTKREALQSAIGEYVERYCSFTGLPESVQSQANYETMERSKLMVPEFDATIHYLDRQYHDIDAEPLERGTEVTWATGTELISGKKMGLPLWLASSRNESPHGFGSSNGCAAGQSLAGAAYRGLLEVIERDALMRCWYTRTTPNQVRLADFPALRTLRDECEPASGRIKLLSLDSDLPFEVIAAAFVGTSGNRPKFLISASARLEFEKAVVDALKELSQQIQMCRRLSVVNETLIKDGERLELGKNGIYYFDSANFEKVEWLVSGDVIRPELTDNSVPTDTATRLHMALEAFERASMDIVLYEVTNPNISEIGLQVVKMVVPELLPLCHPEKPVAAHDRLPNAAVQREPHPIS